MRKISLKGVVFDLDGTLIDSVSFTFEAFNYAIGEVGGSPKTPAEIMQYFGPGETRIFAKLVGDDLAQAAAQLASKYLAKNISRVPLFAGIKEVLEYFRSQGIPLALFTGRESSTTMLILNEHKILNNFIKIVTQDHVENPKPHPEGLDACIRQMRLQPQEVIFIGDSIYDIQAAQRAGSVSCAAVWDLLAEKEQLMKLKPNYVLKSTFEILDLWKVLSIQ